ncbi:MAG TPA: ATPase, partial [Aequorivita sp.]|nr:ATPase [Aequorivita sp.]
MTHTYKIHGMTCNGCRGHVEKTLSEIEGVSKASVNLEKAEAVIEMDKHISLNVFEKAFEDDGGRYSISLPDDAEAAQKHKKKKEE